MAVSVTLDSNKARIVLTATMERRTAQFARWFLLIALVVSVGAVSHAAVTPIHKHFASNPDACAVFHAGGSAVALLTAALILAVGTICVHPITAAVFEWPQSTLACVNFGRAPPVLA
jgi:hypothetical protein